MIANKLVLPNHIDLKKQNVKCAILVTFGRIRRGTSAPSG
jgi:hypothetical protein